MIRFWDFIAHRCPAAAELGRSAVEDVRVEASRVKIDHPFATDAEVAEMVRRLRAALDDTWSAVRPN
mgnify:CR=1 FL=1